MPAAYDGECEQTPELSQKTKDAVFKTVDNFFKKQKMYRTDFNTRQLQSHGQDFVDDKLFPSIKDIINQEIAKDQTDYRKIAIYNYLANIIGYDYQIRHPNEY